VVNVEINSGTNGNASICIYSLPPKINNVTEPDDLKTKSIAVGVSVGAVLVVVPLLFAKK
jgi:hypothetical protein